MAFKDFGLSYEEDIFSVIDRQYGCFKRMASEEAINKTQNATKEEKTKKQKMK